MEGELQIHPEFDLARLMFAELTVDINKIRASVFPSVSFSYVNK
jgi:hypothetical protein